MFDSDGKFKKGEDVALKLRSLYEKYGYKKYKMNRFEEYQLYSENKSFLASESIITFNDLNGRLLALNPDVTLSIVKNAVENSESCVKVHYSEYVCRANSSTHEIKDRMQTGLEHIGEMDDYSNYEAVMLAVKSLDAISENYILDISQLGFVSGLLGALDADDAVKDEILKYISGKNTHEIKRVCESVGAPSDLTNKLAEVSSLYGPFEKTFEKARTLVINDEMRSAADELERLYTALKSCGYADKINLDFSIVNDMNYYNGLIFQGYVEEVPCCVLSGGRYDRLLHKLGKNTGAIGFAVYFDLLELYNNAENEYDVDTVICYDDSVSAADVSKYADEAVGSGKSVSVLKSGYDKIKYRELIKITDKGAEKIG